LNYSSDSGIRKVKGERPKMKTKCVLFIINRKNLLLLATFFLMIYPVMNPGIVPVRAFSGSITENFTDTTYMDSEATNTTGWGSDTVTTQQKSYEIIGSYDTPGNLRDICVAGDYAFLADYGSSLRVLNISDPSNPIYAGYYDNANGAEDLFLAGNILYIADYFYGLMSLDIYNPKSPNLADSCSTPGSAQGVYVSGEYAYIADFTKGLQVINVTNPYDMSLIASCNTTGSAEGVYVSGNYAYVAVSTDGMQVIDITNPRTKKTCYK